MATILFVCLQNAGRSQMSRALFERNATGRHTALSAGTTPAEHVHPEVIEVMRDRVRAAGAPGVQSSAMTSGRGVQWNYPAIAGLEPDLLLVTHEHSDHNGVEAIGEPAVLRSTAGRSRRLSAR